MKKNIIILMAALVGVCGFTSCSEKALDPNSQITSPPKTENEFDKWLNVNYLKPYNIDFKYRFQDVLSDTDYNLSPVEYEQAILMAKLTLTLTLQAYDEVTGGKEFIAKNFPKIIHLIGSPAYNENGSVVLGTAEGGKMMTLYEGNEIAARYDAKNIEELNSRYFATMHHEFAHILHQTTPYSTDFNAVTPADYVGDACFDTYRTDAAARLKGFITRYSSKAPDEDFVEHIARYITMTETQWNAAMAQGGAVGKPLLQQKSELMRAYMLSTWNIDIDKLREVVLRRQSEIWTLDLKTL